jgi:hypothetical protein
MAQAVSRRPLTTEARVRSQVQSMWDLWWTNWHWDRFFSELSVFPCQFHSTGAPLLVKLGKKTALLHHKVAQKALRLWCVRSICCGALHHVKKTTWKHRIWRHSHILCIHPHHLWQSEPGSFILCHEVSDNLDRHPKWFYKNLRWNLFFTVSKQGRSQWPRGIRLGSAAARLLVLQVRIRPGAWMSVSC